MSCNRWKNRLTLLGLLAFLLLPTLASAEAPFRPEKPVDEVNKLLDETAQALTDFLQSHGEKSLVVSFVGPATVQTGAENALLEILGARLKARKIEVVNKATYGYRGELKIQEDGEGKDKRLLLEITGQLSDKKGNAVDLTLPKGAITSFRHVAELLGLTVDRSNRPNLDNVNHLLYDAHDNPKMFLDDNNSRIRAGKDSPFSMQVVVGAKARPIKDRNGQGYFEVNEGDIYRIVLENNTNFEVAARVAVDSLSVFHFSKERSTAPERNGESKFNYYIIAPRSKVAVDGWFQDQTLAKAFKVTPFEDGVAAKLGRVDKVGTISATFHACWVGDNQQPKDEPGVQITKFVPKIVMIPRQRTLPDGKVVTEMVPVQTTSTEVSTGFGSDVAVSYQGVVRTIGTERGTITLRYQKAKPQP